MVNQFEEEDLLRQLRSNPPASRASIQEFQGEAGHNLQQDYVDFLCRSNGGEGFIGESYVVLWRIEELLPKNSDYESAQNAPGLLLFGSDGGGEAFGFDMRSGSMPIVSVPFIGMSWTSAVLLANTFRDFLQTISKLE